MQVRSFEFVTLLLLLSLAWTFCVSFSACNRRDVTLRLTLRVTRPQNADIITRVEATVYLGASAIQCAVKSHHVQLVMSCVNNSQSVTVLLETRLHKKTHVKGYTTNIASMYCWWLRIKRELYNMWYMYM